MKRWAIGLFALVVTFVFSSVAVRLLVFEALSEAPIDAHREELNVEIEPVSAADQAVDPETDVEFFADEKRIGQPERNRVEVKCFNRGENRFAEIKFFSRARDGSWEQKQFFDFEKDNLTECDPESKDFNNDRFRDLTYVSNVAARGGNQVRKLFIYNAREDRLIYIQNSEDFPNLRYNKKLNCIDSWMVHGSSSTVFAKLEGDKLKEFASVGTGLQLTVSVIDKNGNDKLIHQEDMNEDDIYTRYLTYDPPRP